MTKFFTTLVFLLSATAMYAYDYVLEGQVSNKYDVTVYLDVNFNTGKVTGKYCYKSTIKKQGKKPSSYLYLSGTFNPQTDKIQLRVTDHKGAYVESWSGMIGFGNRWTHIDGTITLKNGKKLSVYVDNAY